MAKNTSVLGVPKRQEYPIKEELYKLRLLERTSPVSARPIKRSDSQQPKPPASPSLPRSSSHKEVQESERRTSSVLSRRLSVLVVACISRRLSLGSLPSNRPSMQPSAQVQILEEEKTCRTLEALLKISNRKRRLSQPVTQINKPSDSTENSSSVLKPTQILQQAQLEEDPKEAGLRFVVSMKHSSSSLSPTKVIRKVVNLPKMPFGKHQAYKSDRTFRSQYIIEKESADWLTVHSSNRSSPQRKNTLRSRLT
jgi:hypothetical protein